MSAEPRGVVGDGSPTDRTTYNVLADETTVWVWAKAPKIMRDLEGVTHVWKALFRFRGRHRG